MQADPRNSQLETGNPAYDIAIVGGGLSGSSLACALAGCGLRIAVIESAPPAEDGAPAAFDERVLALAYGSRRILDGLGVWAGLAAAAAPIRRIHVSDRGHFGCVRLDAAEEGVEALGYVLPMRPLGRALAAAARAAAGVDYLNPARCTAAGLTPELATLTLETPAGERTLTARLLVVADGGRTGLQESLGIRTSVRDYGQSAIIANVATEYPHEGVAYERFTDTGPLALLPLDGHRCALVWSVPPDQAGEIAALPDARFLERLQARFGERLGRFTAVGERHVYPLRLTQAGEWARPRLVLVGNAAHTLHPIAGQGFNLGLRDVAVLAEVLAEAARAGDDPGSAAVTRAYARRRRVDLRRTIGLTDALARLFSNDLPPLVLVRDLGLVGMGLVPGLRHWLARVTMGLARPIPRLAGGRPLCHAGDAGDISGQ
ncbi:2-octaprenyl-6-methoxyphenyl hydroxylase [Thioalbus denitrificans]|uniref:2-octaprenyl-6-methoxyphenol hydroxylase /2-octaprenyl-3-methyl-6-methoxy-1,4-benzoquinol hydroxylase n=1 Tax=Thioalbus denitrificans TaxID=547122 RepID=A0A369BUS2_9GAMM|nr:2-octaprenyl-6-methoxyphenyl hydroxylase [Thioalbus denitrificans]RCX24755.1 2-octaprenyl-6-methoxyphenol hydroxylase /2-octaprenyl-3-methyl-6-methoxy-1,4-benzoquinol hydroxylase [Thioalbus denitrificans]